MNTKSKILCVMNNDKYFSTYSVFTYIWLHLAKPLKNILHLTKLRFKLNSLFNSLFYYHRQA